jgi:thiamine biosynthesis lipoprotein
MSLWKPDSALNRLNAAAPDDWVSLPKETLRVLQTALDIGQQSGGAFDISVADAVCAWGFGPEKADSQRITDLLQAPSRKRAHDLLELDLANRRARKHAPARFDLGGIAKGFGTDRLIETARTLGVINLTAGIDGDLRCMGTRPDGSLWPVAIEAPDHDRRAVHSMMELSDTAIATSGDYRHYITLNGRSLSHTMNPVTGGPLLTSPASVTVLHESCMQADAWATALMVLGETTGRQIARARGIQAMFLTREIETIPPQMA